MSDLDALHLPPSVADVLAARGWTASDPAVRDAAPVAARGHNLVVAAPPAPAYAAAALAGLISRLAAGDPARVALALCPPEAVEAWAAVVEPLARAAGIGFVAAQSPGRLTRLLQSGTIRLLLTTPDSAHELVRRAALKADALDGVLLLWPEGFADERRLTDVLGDAPREAQRIVITADLPGTASLVERYAWRAPVADLLGSPHGAASQPVRAAPVAWSRRAAALGDLVEQLDPPALTVWTADRGDHELIRRALRLAGADADAAPVTGGDALPPAAGLVIAWDLPTAERLSGLAARNDVVLLVPPGTEAFTALIAPHRQPLHLRGALDRAAAALAEERGRVTATLERGPSSAAFAAVAPLLERWEAPGVAAALWELWRERPAELTSAPPPRARAPGAKLWIGAGRRDEIAAGELVALLVRDAGVPREAIERIEVRESFSLVELAPGTDAEATADRMTGRTVRKRRIVARVDRGRPGPGAKR